MSERNFHPRFLHSPQYYLAVLKGLIEGLNTDLTDQHIADLLTARGLLAPSGKQWSAERVKHAIYRMRHYKTTPNRLHAALMRFVFEGVVSVADAWVIFQRRPTAGAM